MTTAARLLLLVSLAVLAGNLSAQVKLSQQPVATNLDAGDDLLVNKLEGATYQTRRISWSNVLAGANGHFIPRDGGYGTNIVLSNVTLIGTVVGGGTGGGNLVTNQNQFGISTVLTVKKMASLTNIQAYLGDASGRAITTFGDIFMGDPATTIYGDGRGLTNLSGAGGYGIQAGSIDTNALSPSAHALYSSGMFPTNEWATNAHRTIYVATNGSDTWPGTYLFPKASLSNALEQYTSDFCVFMRPGMYTMTGRTHGKEFGSIPCRDKQRTVIDGPGAKLYWPNGLMTGLYITNCSDVIVRHIEMVGNRTNWMMPPSWSSNAIMQLGPYGMIEVANSSKITFNSVNIRDGWNFGILIEPLQGRTSATLSQTNAMVVVNSRFENFGSIREWTDPPTGLLFYDGAAVCAAGGALIAHNYIKNSSAGIEIYPIEGTTWWDKYPHTLLFGNVIENSRAAGINVQGCPVHVVGNVVRYWDSTNNWTNLVWNSHSGIYLQSSTRAIVADNVFTGFLYPVLAGHVTNVTFVNNLLAEGSRVQFADGRGSRISGNVLVGISNIVSLENLRDCEFGFNQMTDVGTNMNSGSIQIAGVISNVVIQANRLQNNCLSYYGLWYDPGATITGLKLIDNTLNGFWGKYYLPATAGAVGELRDLDGILLDTLTGAQTNVQWRGSLGPVGMALGGTLYATAGVYSASIKLGNGETVTDFRLLTNNGTMAGMVASGTNQNAKVWKTDANGVPAWRDDATGAPGGGITTLNTLTADPQLFAVGTGGTEFAITSATATHTFNLPFVGSSTNGQVRSNDWSEFKAVSGMTNQFAKAGMTNDFAKAGMTNQFALAGTTNSFALASQTNAWRDVVGMTNEFAKAGMTNEFAKAGMTNQFALAGSTNSFALASQTNAWRDVVGMTNEFAKAGMTNDFAKAGMTNQFALAGSTNSFALASQTNAWRDVVGMTNEFAKAGMTNDFAKAGMTNQFALAGTTNSAGLATNLQTGAGQVIDLSYPRTVFVTNSGVASMAVLLTNMLDRNWLVFRAVATNNAATTVSFYSGGTLNWISTNATSSGTNLYLPTSKIGTVVGRVWIFGTTTNIDLFATVQP